ncbi:ATP-dependent Clp protease ATP-binding subunit [Flavobacterium jejuense]|uniref:ATP-dependent Clp protease ATP-binding subunit n=1 Tax=Flavobacterium jejuense TaxID=1544455 RepID=A0ABX0IXZ0_9FLAO|nr:ATP-dependent Clp protease ATP-binding subunit [Flavobacterium jejuense]NHN27612.1 ATP-dependent Clp protease ATP-binding subunit [Flavobacterium jejuense]
MSAEISTQIIHIAKQYAKENLNAKYYAAHLLKAILNQQFDFLKELDAKGVDVFYLDEWADIRISEYPKSSKPSDSPEADESATIILEEAESIEKKNEIGIFPAILSAAITPGVGFSHDQLKSLPLTALTIIEMYQSGTGIKTPEIQFSTATTANSSSNAVSKYCIDRLKSISKNEEHAIIGRDEELKTITEILNRKLKPHVIITGEPGVGKSALIEGFCKKIATKNILNAFDNAAVFEINIGALFAGASYKGEVEDRLQKIFNELKTLEKPILFIDDIHELFDSNQGSGIASIIKSELSKGVITFIGATTPEKFRKTLAKDDALSRRFETLEIKEPNQDLAFRMISSIIESYQKHHDFNISDESQKEAIRLAKRYLKEKSLPDSALDLIDRTMSSLKVAKETIKKELPDLKIQSQDILTIEETEVKEEKIIWLFSDILQKTGKLLNENEKSSTDFHALENHDKKITYLNELLARLEKLEEEENEVLASHLSIVVSEITGIPAGKVKSDERERLLEIENTLKKRVIGQDHAVKVVSDAIMESRSGLTKPGQPIGSFFFLGPTGTGKTELAKSLADFLFGDENAIIRLDMSEFKEEHSAALLYGAPPGYVGYEEGGLLVNKIRQKPYSLVLFDEIEKAHKSVFDVFLQILDEGKLHDRLGKEGDFSNSVVLFTSNIGSDFIVKSFEKDVIPKSNDLIQLMTGHFRPEFLGRLTEIIPFAPINVKSVSRIFDIHLKKELLQLLEKLEITLEISEKDKEKIALQGFSPEYGARPIKGSIRNKLKRPLSRMIIANEIIKGDTVKVTLDKNEELKFTVTNERPVL